MLSLGKCPWIGEDRRRRRVCRVIVISVVVVVAHCHFVIMADFTSAFHQVPPVTRTLLLATAIITGCVGGRFYEQSLAQTKKALVSYRSLRRSTSVALDSLYPAPRVPCSPLRIINAAI